jgi:hypothetical protein
MNLVGGAAMKHPDVFSAHYAEQLDSTYDAVDRLVLRAYCPLLQAAGGFRTWWRRLFDEEKLDDTHLMRFAGRFSRRIHAWAPAHNIPLVHCSSRTRKDEIAAEYRAQLSPEHVGIFCILVAKAPASVWEVKRFENGTMDIRRKQPFVNYYYFHLMDPDWGHVMIRFCPHPPFNAMVILNGHEYLARQARTQGLRFRKEDNCFTDLANAPAFAGLADTMKASGFEGRLAKVCERWLYSACLCFALDSHQQEESGFCYTYSVLQAEYSRNLLFHRRQVMDEIFESVIDRTRAPLALPQIKTIFGYQRRPYKKANNGKRLRFEEVVETPTYDLTVFRLHFGKLTVKMYSKGERVLRIEAVAHNAKALRVGTVLSKFPTIVEVLQQMVERFLQVISGVNAAFIDLGAIDALSTRAQLGSSNVAGIDLQSPRIRAVMSALLSLAPKPDGFVASDLAEQVHRVIGQRYQPTQAAYDLRKFRARGLVVKLQGTRRYQITEHGIAVLTVIARLREQVLRPLIAGMQASVIEPAPNQAQIDSEYQHVTTHLSNILQIQGINAA